MAHTLPDVWGCVPQPERAADRAMAAASASMSPFVPVAAIDAIFLSYDPGWYETRRTAWVEMYRVTETEIEIEELTVAVFLANRAWMADLYTCMLLGGCAQDAPLCRILTFASNP